MTDNKDGGAGDELWRRSALELGDLIRRREVSSVEVIEAHLERIEVINPVLNAVTVTLAESALDAAKAADAASERPGALHGVPFTIKENIDCMGSATTSGVPAMVDVMPTSDAPVVERMKAAGAIPLARTNLPELGLRITTDNPLRGRTLNPWTPDLTAGGSSGGEGSALASGMTPFGLGNDIGGSLRNPAYCCGITALKPTVGRIPHASSIPPEDGGLAAQLMAVEGPMARRVADLRAGLGILAGCHARDPVSVDAPLTVAPAPQRMAVVTDVPGVRLPAAHVAGIEKAASALQDAGWEVEATSPPELALVTEVWAAILAMDFASLIPTIRPIMSAPALRLLEQICERWDPARTNTMALHAERARLSRLWTAFFAKYPVMIGPVWTDLPFAHDADLDPESGLDLTVDRLRFISPGNVLGLPSVALPVGIHDGLPQGVQVYADRWQETRALDAAAEIEAAVGTLCPVDPAFTI